MKRVEVKFDNGWYAEVFEGERLKAHSQEAFFPVDLDGFAKSDAASVKEALEEEFDCEVQMPEMSILLGQGPTERVVSL